MKHTNKKIYIQNKTRTLYQNKKDYYYRFNNKYHKINNKQLKFIGGEGDGDGEGGGEDEKNLQNAIRKFVSEKRITKNKILLFDEIIKYYKRIFNEDIIDSIKNSLKFLSKYNSEINVLIDTYKHNDEGELNSSQISMLITNLKKFIFEKIFINYFINIMSKYYDENGMKTEIEELMHMLTFVEDDRKEEMLYKQKINILLSRLSDYSSKFKTGYDTQLNYFDNIYGLLKENKTEDGEEQEDDGEYDDMTLDKFVKVKQGILKEFKENLEEKETKLIEMQQTMYWWNNLGPTLESEFKETNKSYIKSLEIFFNELIRETIYKDLAIEELKNKRQPDDDDKMDPALYNIYVDFLRNEFLKKIKRNNLNEETINGNVSYEEYKKLNKAGKTEEDIKKKLKLESESEIELGIKGKFKKSIDEYIDGEIKTLEDELSELIKTKQKIIPSVMQPMQTAGDEESISILRDKITKTKNKFQKMKKILIDKMLKYTDILLILAKANKDKEDNNTSSMVTKQSFKDMTKILILFLKQHILNFSEPFRKILNDIKRYHEIIIVEVENCDKLLRYAENE